MRSIVLLLLVSYVSGLSPVCRKGGRLRSDLNFKYTYKNSIAGAAKDIDFSQRTGEYIYCDAAGTQVHTGSSVSTACESVARAEGPGMDRFGWAKQLAVGTKGSIKVFAGDVTDASPTEFTAGDECGSSVKMSLGGHYMAAVCKKGIKVFRYDGTAWSEHDDIDMTTAAIDLEFDASGNDHFVYNGQNDTDISLCTSQSYNFKRVSGGHPLRVVKESECTGCESGTHSFPSSSVTNWADVNGDESKAFTFTEAGTYYYLCSSHANMVGKITVSSCSLDHEVKVDLNHEDYMIVSKPSAQEVKIYKLGAVTQEVQSLTGDGEVAAAVNCRGSVFAYGSGSSVKVKQLSQKDGSWSDLADISVDAVSLSMSNDVMAVGLSDKTKVYMFANGGTQYAEYKSIDIKGNKVSIEHDDLAIIDDTQVYLLNDGPSTKCLALQKLDNGVCIDCGGGHTNAHDNTETTCNIIPCSSSQYAQGNTCYNCPAGSTNPAGPATTDSVCACPAGKVFNMATLTAPSCDTTFCLEDEHVAGNVCEACPAGTTNAVDDDASGANTTCDATLCGVNEHVVSNACANCTAGSTNAKDDDASGADTVCDPDHQCLVNQFYTEAGACQNCPDGSEKVEAISNLDGDTSCDPIICAENENVVSGGATNLQCGTCQAGTERPAGDDATLGLTQCLCSAGTDGDGTTCTACLANQDSVAGEPCKCTAGHESGYLYASNEKKYAGTTCGSEGDCESACSGDASCEGYSRAGLAASDFCGGPSTGNPNSLAQVTGSCSSVNIRDSQAIAMDSNKDLYVQAKCQILKISNGVVSLFVGQEVPDTCSNVTIDATGSNSSIGGSSDMKFDSQGNLITISDQQYLKITPEGAVTTLAGTGDFDTTDGNSTFAKFKNPEAFDFDAAGNILGVDRSSGKIRSITANGDVTTECPSITLNSPYGVAYSTDGSNIGLLYVAETDANKIRLVNLTDCSISVWKTEAGWKPYKIKIDGDHMMVARYDSCFEKRLLSDASVVDTVGECGTSVVPILHTTDQQCSQGTRALGIFVSYTADVHTFGLVTWNNYPEITKDECYQYQQEHWPSYGFYSTGSSGTGVCGHWYYYQTGHRVYWNENDMCTTGNNYVDGKCVKRYTTSTSYTGKYMQEHADGQSVVVPKEACQAFATGMSLSFSETDDATTPQACYVDTSSPTHTVVFNTNTNAVQCSSTHRCVKIDENKAQSTPETYRDWCAAGCEAHMSFSVDTTNARCRCSERVDHCTLESQVGSSLYRYPWLSNANFVIDGLDVYINDKHNNKVKKLSPYYLYGAKQADTGGISKGRSIGCATCPANSNSLPGVAVQTCVKNEDAIWYDEVVNGPADAGACVNGLYCNTKSATSGACISAYEDGGVLQATTSCCRLEKPTKCLCDEDHRVSSGACVACATGEVRPAGDDPDNGNTYCNTQGLTLAFTNNGNSDFVYNAQNDPDIQLKVGQLYTFLRDSAGHPLRVVSAADCPSCSTGTWSELPTSSVSNVDSEQGSANIVWKPRKAGTYYYVCTSHPDMVGKLVVTWDACALGGTRGTLYIGGPCQFNSQVSLNGPTSISVATARLRSSENIIVSMDSSLASAIDATIWPLSISGIEITDITSDNPFAKSTTGTIDLNGIWLQDNGRNTQSGALFKTDGGGIIAQNVAIDNTKGDIFEGVNGGDVSLADSTISNSGNVIKQNGGAVLVRGVSVTGGGKLADIQDATSVFEDVTTNGGEGIDAVKSSVQIERSNFKGHASAPVKFNSKACSASQCKRELIVENTVFEDAAALDIQTDSANKPRVKIIEGNFTNSGSVSSDNGIELYVIDEIEGKEMTTAETKTETCLAYQCSHKPLATSCKVETGKGTKCVCDIGVSTYKAANSTMEKATTVNDILAMLFATGGSVDRIVKLVDEGVRYIPTQPTSEAAKSNILLTKPTNADGEFQSEKTILMKPDTGVICATFQTWMCTELTACHYANGTMTADCDGTKILNGTSNTNGNINRRRLFQNRFFKLQAVHPDDPNCAGPIVNLRQQCQSGSVFYSRCVQEAQFHHDVCKCAPGLSANSGGTACVSTQNLCKLNERVSSGRCVACVGDLTNKAGDDRTGGNTACDDTICKEYNRVLNGACVPCAAGEFNLAGDIAKESGVDKPDTQCCGAGEYEFETTSAAPFRTCKSCADPTDGIRARFGVGGAGLQCCGNRLGDNAAQCARIKEYYRKVCQPLENAATCPAQDYS